MKIPFIPLRLSIVAVLIPWLFLLSGCVSGKVATQKTSDAEKSRILSGSGLFQGPTPESHLPDDNVLMLTDEMKSFIDHAVSGYKGRDEKLKALLDAIVSPGTLGLKYDAEATYTARDTFSRKSANCLSFSIMMISMLRYLGYEAQFNDVEVPPVWDLQNDRIMVLFRHVNVMITGPGRDREVIDFYMDEYNIHYPQNLIEDNVAVAQYYNNRGMEFLLQGNTTEAFRYLLKAVTINPDAPYIWVNLGALYRNSARLDEAEIAYRAALDIDPNYYVAISNIERVYREQGRDDRAEEFGQRARYYRLRNPYYLYKLAVDSFLDHDYETALRDIRTAIRKYEDEHRFHFLQGAIYKAMDRPEQARASFQKAIELTSTQKQIDKYRRKIEQLM